MHHSTYPDNLMGQSLRPSNGILRAAAASLLSFSLALLASFAPEGAQYTQLQAVRMTERQRQCPTLPPDRSYLPRLRFSSPFLPSPPPLRPPTPRLLQGLPGPI